VVDSLEAYPGLKAGVSRTLAAGWAEWAVDPLNEGVLYPW